ncbi:hypothetical protein [Cryptosporangium aurantiacum]|uniref:hypothetical protein n=1 Tax=Cryptosporangium aurantiacum TaxID=134849 RepID=UPI0015B7D94F|nr:hypothetical protein [Cryptosporangium aurantiacum]
MSFGWVFLGASVAAYGVANFLQSVAAARVSVHAKLDPGLLLKLAGHRIYVAGLVCQLGAFLFAFLARRDLPLFLVQTAVAGGLGVTVLLGVAFLRWRHPLSEVILLGALVLGLAALIISAETTKARPLNGPEVLALALSVPIVGLLGRAGARLHGSPGSVALGALSGLSFGAVAIASRPLAGAQSFGAFVTDPLLYILLAHTVIGQLLLGLAMQRGSTTAAVASMDAAAAIPPALVGLLLLGDRIAPGREWLAAIGFVTALGSVLLLTRYAEPQHHVRDRYEAQGRCRPRSPAVAPAHANGASAPGAAVNGAAPLSVRTNTNGALDANGRARTESPRRASAR